MTADETYFVLMNHVTRTTARFENEPRLPNGADMWIDGRPVKVEVPKPLTFEIEPGDEGEMAAYIRTAIPLMSDVLVETLRGCGVDNLQVYDAVIHETGTGRTHTNYRAVNVVGVIDAIDRSKSTLTSLEGLGTWVNGMVLDEKATREALLFRLGHSLSKIIVHRRVKEAVEAKQLPLIYFVPTTGLDG